MLRLEDEKRLALAEKFLKEGQLKPALVHFQMVIAHSEDPEASFRVASIMANYNQHKKAIEFYKLSIDKSDEKTPPDTRAAQYINRALSYCELQRYKHARDDFIKATEFEPGNLQLWYSIAITYLESGKPEKALKDLNHVIEQKKTTAQPIRDEEYFYLGYALYRLGRHEEAKVDFETIIQRNPKYAYAHYFLGLCKQKLNNDGLIDIGNSFLLDPKNFINMSKTDPLAPDLLEKIPMATAFREEIKKSIYPVNDPVAEGHSATTNLPTGKKTNDFAMDTGDQGVPIDNPRQAAASAIPHVREIISMMEDVSSEEASSASQGSTGISENEKSARQALAEGSVFKKESSVKQGNSSNKSPTTPVRGAGS